jgi:hypothetical protein
MGQLTGSVVAACGVIANVESALEVFVRENGQSGRTFKSALLLAVAEHDNALSRERKRRKYLKRRISHEICSLVCWPCGLDAADVHKHESVPIHVSNLCTTIPGLDAGGVITISQTEMPVLLPLSPNEARRDAGGSRTHLNRVAAGRLAIWLQRRKVMSMPGIEPGPRPSQSRMQIRHTPRAVS